MKTARAITFASSALFALTTANDEVVGTIGYLPVNETSSTASAKSHIFAAAGDYCLVGQNMDFNGGDLSSSQAAPNSCCNLCKANAACAGYTWTNFRGGTCWLKSNVASPRIYIGAKGCVTRGDNSPTVVARFSNCDMPGNDQSNIQVAESNFSKCELICWVSSECKAVTWTNYLGGTCWLKTGVTECANFPGAKTTVMFNEGRFGRR